MKALKISVACYSPNPSKGLYRASWRDIFHADNCKTRLFHQRTGGREGNRQKWSSDCFTPRACFHWPKRHNNALQKGLLARAQNCNKLVTTRNQINHAGSSDTAINQMDGIVIDNADGMMNETKIVIQNLARIAGFLGIHNGETT